MCQVTRNHFLNFFGFFLNFLIFFHFKDFLDFSRIKNNNNNLFARAHMALRTCGTKVWCHVTPSQCTRGTKRGVLFLFLLFIFI